MVNTLTFPATTLSTTVSPLLSGITYYYTIQAFNNTTPGPTSSVQSNSTQPTTTFSLILISGRPYINNNQLAVALPSTTNEIHNNTDGLITLTNGDILCHTIAGPPPSNYILDSLGDFILLSNDDALVHA